MNKYIDLHNHILPAIDDGPRTINESVMLASALVKAGYGTVVATPHTFEGKPSPDLILERLNELQEELNRQQVDLKLLPGAEQHIEPHVLERLEAGEVLTLNNSRYLLLELPMLQPLPAYTEELIFKLAVSGYRPVIPHPERVVFLQDNLKLLKRLSQTGAIFQLTWGALTGIIGPVEQKTALLMLQANLAHLFATDAHNFSSRLISSAAASALLEKEHGPGTAERYLIERPLRVICDQTLDINNA